MTPFFFLALLAGAGVADWVSEQGGRVERDRSGNIVAVDLTHKWVSDADLARLAGLPHLRTLALSETRVTDHSIEHLKNLPALVSFECYFCEFISDDSVAVMKSWKKLERLQLRGTKVTSKALEHLAQIPTLRSLDLSHTEIDDEGFDLLGSLTALERLAIGANRLEGSALTALKSAPSLRHLDAGGIQRVDSGLWGLALNEANLARLGELTQLISLNLSGANLNDRGLDRPGHPEAERTEMRDLSALAGLTNLEELALTRTKVTPEALMQLSKLPRLVRLRLGLTPNLTSEAIGKFAAARPACVIVH